VTAPPASAPAPTDLSWADGSVRLPGIGPGTSVLVTGGTGAIGLRLAEAFIGLGARVAITSRSASRAAALGDHSTFDQLGEATIDALLAANVKGVLLVAQAAVPRRCRPGTPGSAASRCAGAATWTTTSARSCSSPRTWPGT
jgi:NAD(P)-dependent dehydrogenase (short-subunit alcohol dehydrogenase family)